jgi:hypothetical protein
MVIQFLTNTIQSIDYNGKSPFVPLLLGSLPVVSYLVSKVKSAQLSAAINQKWDGVTAQVGMLTRFENDKEVSAFKVLKLVEVVGSLIHRILLAAFTIFNRNMPKAAGVTLFIAGNVLLTLLDTQRTGAPVLSFNEESGKTLVLYL